MQLVVVIGMHRSGTSLAMQALAALGVEVGEALIGADAHNPRGYLEAAQVVALHDDLLGDLGRGWGTPEHLLPLPPGWGRSAAGRRAQARIAAVLEARIAAAGGAERIALKDPRLTLFLPLWRRAARRLGVGMRIVLCLRHPAAVAASLAARDRFAVDYAQALWLSYTVAGVAGAAGGQPLLLCPHEGWRRAPGAQCAALAGFLGLEPPADAHPFEADLNHHPDPGAIADPLVARWWAMLSALPVGAPLPRGLLSEAEAHLASAAHLSVLARQIRAEVGATPSWQLSRDATTLRQGAESHFAAYRAEAAQAVALRETLVLREAEIASLAAESDRRGARSDELLAAYQAEAATSAALRAALGAREAELAALAAESDRRGARSDELLAAYQAEAAMSAALRAALGTREAELAALAAETDRRGARSDELLAAYQAEAATSAALRAALGAREAELAALAVEADRRGARSDELLAAYQAEAATSAALRAAPGAREAEIALLSAEAERRRARAEELLAAYQAEAAKSELLRRKLDRFNPVTWLRGA